MLKLALPLVAGVIIGWLCDIEVLHIATLFVVSLVVLSAGLFPRVPRWLFGVGVTGVMLAVGLFVMGCDKRNEAPVWGGAKVPCEAVLLEVPYMGGVTTSVLAHVAVDDSARREGVRGEGRVRLYIVNCVEAEELQVGEKIRFDAVVKNPANRGNPAEFDVAHYMRVKGVTGTVFLPVGAWRSVGFAEKGVAMLALALRAKVVAMYEKLGFEGDELSLLSAFSVGERRGFSDTLRDAYACAGLSHILALSGLHLGIFYMVLLFVFSFAGNARRVVVVRELVVILLLWAFAFVAGLSSSVVRAAILFTLVSIGRCLRRDASSLNSLAFAGVVMLLFEPRLLFDVGFQLSFSAVAAVLLWVPCVQRLLRVDEHGGLYGFFASLMAVSLVAQIGVLPFVWYYFGSFPVYFLLANIFVVPFASVLMSAVVLLWVLAFAPLLQIPVAWFLSIALKGMNGFVEFVASLPGSSLVLPEIGVPGACLVALSVALLFMSLASRKVWVAVLVAFVSCLVFLLNIFATEKVREDYILLFNNDKSAAVLAVTEGGDSYCLSSVPKLDADCSWVVEPFVARERLSLPRWVGDGFSCEGFCYREGLLSFAGVRLQLLADDCWRENSVQRPVDALLLCRGYLGAVEELLQVFPARCVILDGSLYEGSRRRLIRECGKVGVPCLDIASEGALKIVAGDGDFSILPMRGR